MHAILLMLVLAQPSPRADCKPQFAPLETGTTSGISRVPFWRKEEAGEWGGKGWLGWTRDSDRLEPVEFIVRDRPRDSPDDDDQVTVQTVPDVDFGVRCIPQLNSGSILSAGVVNESLQRDSTLNIALGARKYRVSLESRRADLADARVVLADGRRTQVLYTNEGFADEPHYEVVWAGDLDRDGQLDLIVNLHRKYSWHPYRLLLSSKARAGQLVGDAALFETGD